MIISDVNILFPQIVAWDNLLLAYNKAAKGKRGRHAAAAFEFKLADNLLSLQTELTSGSYQPGQYQHFYIREPKRRKISAAPFRDRVVHHALCNVIEPIFEAKFHPHSYANRIGKGTHRAIEQLQMYCRRYHYVLRLDIIKHFPSIDHTLLKESLFETITDRQTQALISTIIDSGNGVLADQYIPTYFAGDDLFSQLRPRGLPIGNLTSQFWSNCYLNKFDWFVSRELGCRAYVRYVDDFALFANSKRTLWQWKRKINAFLVSLRLKVHTSSAQVHRSEDGVPWLGFIVYPTHKLLKQRNVQQAHRRLKNNLKLYHEGELSFAEFDASVQGWINHVRYGDTWSLREKVFRRQIINPMS